MIAVSSDRLEAALWPLATSRVVTLLSVRGSPCLPFLASGSLVNHLETDSLLWWSGRSCSEDQNNKWPLTVSDTRRPCVKRHPTTVGLASTLGNRLFSEHVCGKPKHIVITKWADRPLSPLVLGRLWSILVIIGDWIFRMEPSGEPKGFASFSAAFFGW